MRSLQILKVLEKYSEPEKPLTYKKIIYLLEDEFDVLFESEDILHYGSYLNGIEILKRYGIEF